MARPRKQTADWFPHYVDDGKTKYILESRWGNDGYAFWFKLLELLCKTDGHIYDYGNAVNKQFLLARMKMPEETIEEIVATLIDLGNIDRELWEDGQRIWCQGLVDNIKPLYLKRKDSVPEKPTPGGLPQQKPDDTVDSDAEMTVSEAETEVTAEETPEPEPEKKTRKKKDEPPKVKYGEYVRMTEAEHQKLLDEYGPEMTARMIEVLDNYKGSKGKTYKNDYRAILSWVVDRVKEEFAKRGGSSYGGFNTDRGPARKPAFTPSTGFRRADTDGDGE